MAHPTGMRDWNEGRDLEGDQSSSQGGWICV